MAQMALHAHDEFASADLHHWWFVGRRAVIEAALVRHVPPGSRFLDVGCGRGALTADLARHFRVEGVDVDPEQVEATSRRGIPASVVEPEKPLPDGFDAVGAFDVLEHVDDDVGFATRLAAATRPGGVVAVAVPAYRSLWGPSDAVAGHHRRYRLPEVVAVMAAAGVRTAHATYFNTMLFPVIAPLRLLGYPRHLQGIARPPPEPVNRWLASVFRAEASVVPTSRLPFGASILYVGRVA
jgi:SAM-dependent methyltransferase